MVRNMPHNRAGAVVLQSNLLDIGLNVEILAYDQALVDTYMTEPIEWDVLLFPASGLTTGYVADAWGYFFGTAGEQGTIGFVKDAKLQELLNTAIEKNDAVALNAFRDYYLIEQAYAINVKQEAQNYVATKGITNMPGTFLNNPVLNACTFSDDYIPAAAR